MAMVMRFLCFTCDLFMLIPAFFRLIGFTVSTANRMFYMCITLATLLIAYYSFQKIFQRKEIGCVGAVLYVLASYRMHNLYMRSAVGEAVAMTFLPLIVYGFYRILVKEVPENREDYLRKLDSADIWPHRGDTESHVITCEMLAFCILVLCLVRIKKSISQGNLWAFGENSGSYCFGKFLVPGAFPGLYAHRRF